MPMDVDAAALSRLLDLQGSDSAIMRLEHRKETLEEAERLRAVNEQLAELGADLEIARKQGAEIAREQDRIEGEMELLDTKIQKEEQRLFSGGVSNPKELSALQAEVEMLKRRKGEQEDALLEVMVNRDQATATIRRLEAEQAEVSQTSQQLTETVGSIMSEIDSELESNRARRTSTAAELPSDLIALYDQIRSQKGGVGAAALVAGTCEGCHTQLPNKEVERLKTEGGLQRCENCRRILVVV
jgi:predicted  nucleic acid-binding Zn-ribbon protein